MTKPTARLADRRWMLVLIASIAIIPFLLAWFYAQHPELLSRRSNYGNLIIPAEPLAYEDLLGASASPDSALAEVKGRWILLQVLTSGTACDPACLETSHAARQIRLLLNKDIPRVRRLIASSDPDFLRAAEGEEDPDLLYGVAGPALVETLTRALGRRPEPGMLIVIDPFANAMMWYPSGFDPYGVLGDLKHLLRSSQIG